MVVLFFDEKIPGLTLHSAFLSSLNKYEVKMKRFFSTRAGIISAGILIGAIAVFLQFSGNPANMGVCVACFERDIAGALGLHRAAAVQYIRPEIIGFVLGSFIIAIAMKEYRPRGGSSSIIRFFLGVFAVFGALVFLGCPWRTILRIAGGDGNALVGFAGLASGILAGVVFLKNGYTLGRSYNSKKSAGWVFPAFMLGLLLLLVYKVSFGEGAPIFFSSKGPGSQHADIWLSLGGGLIIGAIAQRSRFCTMGSVRDVFLARDLHLISGVGAMLASAFILNYFVLGQFKPGFEAQPVAHSDALWNFFGMFLSGGAFTLAGGCPGRQLILAGEGDSDSAVFAVGMIVGAAFAHNFAIASKPDQVVDGVLKIGGPAFFGQAAIVIGIIFILVLGFTMREKVS